MEVDLWGVRGTAPVSGSDKDKYGGQTLCASLSISEEEVVIIDAGTGIRKLGEKLVKEKIGYNLHLHLFLTHFHLDHIMGIPFFLPLYSSNTDITFYAPALPEETEKYLGAIMGGRFFPVDFKETACQKIFKEAPEKNFKLGNFQISSCPLRHPQGSIAYKIEAEEGSIVFSTDTEHPEDGVDKRLVSFVCATDNLIYDALFTPEEYEDGKQGWGHSTWLAGTELAKEAEVKNLYLSHFNPNHSDNKIDVILSLAQKEFPRTLGANEGMQIII